MLYKSTYRTMEVRQTSNLRIIVRIYVGVQKFQKLIRMSDCLLSRRQKVRIFPGTQILRRRVLVTQRSRKPYDGSDSHRPQQQRYQYIGIMPVFQTGQVSSILTWRSQNLLDEQLYRAFERYATEGNVVEPPHFQCGMSSEFESRRQYTIRSISEMV